MSEERQSEQTYTVFEVGEGTLLERSERATVNDISVIQTVLVGTTALEMYLAKNAIGCDVDNAKVYAEELIERGVLTFEGDPPIFLARGDVSTLDIFFAWKRGHGP